MTFQSLLNLVGPHLATAIVGCVSGFLPLVNMELYLVVAGTMVSDRFPVWTLGIAAGLGQMIAKSSLYWGGGSALHSRAVRKFTHERIETLTDRMRGMKPWLLNTTNFASALFGLPPFLLVSILAGTIKMKFWQFYVTGLIGMSIRLAFVVEFPHLLRKSIW